ncbi:MAG: hypothetical protein E3K37_12940 [Candidatus Kuenenia sp.]|nr:hypothetical protein [Candidatus Kuenenia hertensis]
MMIYYFSKVIINFKRYVHAIGSIPDFLQKQFSPGGFLIKGCGFLAVFMFVWDSAHFSGPSGNGKERLAIAMQNVTFPLYSTLFHSLINLPIAVYLLLLYREVILLIFQDYLATL